MIVNVRGTSGSGKSTLVRRVMDFYPIREPVRVEWRKQPLGYLCYREGRTLWVPGHYETDCGGCDTLPSVDVTYNLVRKYVDQCDVMYEGLITQSDVNRCIQLHKDGLKLLVIGLTTPLQDCIASVQARRDAKAAARGKESSPLDPGNTKSKHRAVLLQEPKFRSVGIDFRWLDREAALVAVKEALNIP